ncbi:MAG: hypothetical protein RLZZ241_2568 [Bacteroidota bacterium]|jgi:hypothetical protein
MSLTSVILKFALLIIGFIALQAHPKTFYVLNKTAFSFENLNLFGASIKKLDPGCKSGRFSFSYNPVTDDKMFYANVDSNRFASYVKLPDAECSKFFYSIDSLVNGIVFVQIHQIR